MLLKMYCMLLKRIHLTFTTWIESRYIRNDGRGKMRDQVKTRVSDECVAFFRLLVFPFVRSLKSCRGSEVMNVFLFILFTFCV